MFKKIIFIVLITLFTISIQADEKTYKMVFVPASEKGDENDYKSLISIVEKITNLNIETIKVTDYNAAVEAMRAGRAHIAWYGGKTYVKAAEIANADAFAAGVRPGEKDAGYYTYFVVKKNSKLNKFKDVKGKILSLNTIGSTSGDLIPQVELNKINLNVKNKNHFINVFYAGSHDACLLAVLNNQSDVCGMSSRNFEARLEDGTIKLEDVRIIHKSDRVPPPPLAYSKSIPLEDRNKIKMAVLDAHNHGEIAGYGGKMSHYMEVKDSDYNVLRDVIELLQKNKS
ncbi:MAG: phosphate/phosphite/phosphonate ABC transporter substrate-binding protein [Pelagibacteraceae bacterium]|jgi:phosphonate transport system substrate-binding protein|nr:phosphate/phosphite/phosphonate ABC transporter substrate-binding protein [Pelagibacteraceae bacterium]MBT6355279.1 phosphate/phosphite/phosphonate ABC transporter substrate-binding protein [Pelagibacteraceae bacterium]